MLNQRMLMLMMMRRCYEMFVIPSAPSMIVNAKKKHFVGLKCFYIFFTAMYLLRMTMRGCSDMFIFPSAPLAGR